MSRIGTCPFDAARMSWLRRPAHRSSVEASDAFDLTEPRSPADLFRGRGCLQQHRRRLDDTDPNTQTMTKNAGDAENAAVGTTVAVAPSVKIADQSGNGVSGVTVTFAVATGGGSVTGASATTGGNGVATVGGWTLGITVGANTLTASAS